MLRYVELDVDVELIPCVVHMSVGWLCINKNHIITTHSFNKSCRRRRLLQ